MWATTIPQVDEYEKSLWYVPSADAIAPTRILRHASKGRLSRASTVDAASSSLQALVSLNSLRHKRPSLSTSAIRERLRRAREAQDSTPEPNAEPKRYHEYEALPHGEKRQRMRDYLDGKRPDWR